jgi:hypothetical protein
MAVTLFDVTTAVGSAPWANVISVALFIARRVPGFVAQSVRRYCLASLAPTIWRSRKITKATGTYSAVLIAIIVQSIFVKNVPYLIRNVLATLVMAVN